MDKSVFKELESLLPDGAVLYDEPMSAHTSFRIGGPADVFVSAKEPEAVKVVLAFGRKADIPVTVIGNGSNLLVSDKGVEGIVLSIKDTGTELPAPVYADDEKAVFEVSAGMSLSAFSKACAKAGYTGTETLAGIPGSVGGGVAMNAGAYGGEIKDVLKSARVLDKDLNEKVLTNAELELGYRRSRVLSEGLIVLSAEFELKRGNAEESLAKISELNKKRKDKQPLELPSGGSTFKRPEGYFAGKLIEDAGLRGFRFGNAAVSEKHCGFVVNLGGATCAEVLTLMDEVKKKVFENSGVGLEPELRMIGRK
ncbi:MAG: UDP-N-acetylmuramate dehydrogenase [Lachnospiraceae bacterium]|nr:UDP-N-acetylmuramate dehydrogenase [Lachnospiraceae bacterium]